MLGLIAKASVGPNDFRLLSGGSNDEVIEGTWAEGKTSRSGYLLLVMSR